MQTRVRGQGHSLAQGSEEGEQAHSPEAAYPPQLWGRLKEACPPFLLSASETYPTQRRLGLLLGLQGPTGYHGRGPGQFTRGYPKHLPLPFSILRFHGGTQYILIFLDP